MLTVHAQIRGLRFSILADRTLGRAKVEECRQPNIGLANDMVRTVAPVPDTHNGIWLPFRAMYQALIEFNE